MSPRPGCVSCPAGSIATNSGTALCSACFPGYFAHENNLECVACQIGKFQASSAGTDEHPGNPNDGCRECLKATYNDQEAQTACVACDAGKYILANDVSVVNHDEASDCKECPVIPIFNFWNFIFLNIINEKKENVIIIERNSFKEISNLVWVCLKSCDLSEDK